MHALAAPGEDTDAQFKFLSLARQYLMEGGPDRIGYTLPPLVFATLRLVQRVRKVGTWLLACVGGWVHEIEERDGICVRVYRR